MRRLGSCSGPQAVPWCDERAGARGQGGGVPESGCSLLVPSAELSALRCACAYATPARDRQCTRPTGSPSARVDVNSAALAQQSQPAMSEVDALARRYATKPAQGVAESNAWHSEASGAERASAAPGPSSPQAREGPHDEEAGPSTRSDFTEHVLSKSDTLAGLAIKHNVGVSDIKRANGLMSESMMWSRRDPGRPGLPLQLLACLGARAGARARGGAARYQTALRARRAACAAAGLQGAPVGPRSSTLAARPRPLAVLPAACLGARGAGRLAATSACGRTRPTPLWQGPH